LYLPELNCTVNLEIRLHARPIGQFRDGSSAGGDNG
jgi:hypothetical protein